MKDRLIEIFGKDNVSDDYADRLTDSTDATGIMGSPTFIVWPTEEKQIHKLIQLANRKDLNLTIRGAGTGLAGGSVPEESIVVDMSMMDKIIEVRPDEREVTCQPGVVIDDLNQALDKYDLFFPILPSSSQACQIGGVAATNAAGLRALEYGRAENWIKSIEFFDGTGKLITLKYPQEVIGTEGILGIITKLTLKLTYPPGKRTLKVIKTDNVDETFKMIQEFSGSGNVSAIEFFNSTTAQLGGYVAKDHLLIEFNDDTGDLKDDEDIDEVWEMRRGLGPEISAEGYLLMEDPKIPLASMKKFLRWINNNNVPAFGHIGIGIFHPRFKKTQQKLIKEMFEFVEKIGGNASGEHGIGIRKKEYIDPVRLEELKELKKRYDPNNIMNRGKVI